MVEKFNEKANALATEYWRLKEITTEKSSENMLAAIEKLLEKGIGGRLREKLDAEAKRLRREMEERSVASVKLDDVKREILELTAESAPNLDLFETNFFPFDSEHEPVSEGYLSALTDIFFGTPSPSIQFKVATFSKEGIRITSTGEYSSLKVLEYVIMIIQETAKKKLGMENNIDKICLLLKQNEYAFTALGVLFKEGKRLGMKELKEISYREDMEYKELMSDTYDKELVSGVTYLVSAESELGYSLVKEYNGKYEATDFGEWVWRICTAEVNAEEWKKGGKDIPRAGLNLNFHKILKFIRK